jgi:hypothetical protein
MPRRRPILFQEESLMRAVRWSDNDRYFGPFTFAVGDFYRTFALSLRSSDDEDRAASFRLSVGRFSMLCALPGWVIRPEKKRVQAKYWSAEQIEHMGRDWYWDVTPREYGIRLDDGHLAIHYGRVTMDSSTEQYWGCFLPWSQWRCVRHTYFDLDGKEFWTQRARWTLNGAGTRKAWIMNYEERRKIEETVPTRKFVFKDFDGELLTATVRLDEAEHRLGERYFSWLSIFRRPKIYRGIDIRFSGETGRRKGSWKGGTVGHSGPAETGELHEAAFKRYCAEHEMTFVVELDA